MAIAAVVLNFVGSPQALETALRAMPETVDLKLVPPAKFAATLEAPSEKIVETLQKAERLPNVIDLELVYCNYEDDLDEQGHMKAPPFEERKRKFN